MATELVKEFTTKAKERISELEPMVREYEELQKHLGAWEGESQPQAKRGPGRPAGSRQRAKRGTRASEFVSLVKDNPGIQVSEVARKMNIQPNYLYRIASDLKKDGTLVNEGRGYKVAEAS